MAENRSKRVVVISPNPLWLGNRRVVDGSGGVEKERVEKREPAVDVYMVTNTLAQFFYAPYGQFLRQEKLGDLKGILGFSLTTADLVVAYVCPTKKGIILALNEVELAPQRIIFAFCTCLQRLNPHGELFVNEEILNLLYRYNFHGARGLWVSDELRALAREHHQGEIPSFDNLIAEYISTGELSSPTFDL